MSEATKILLLSFLQIVIAVTLLNVWLVRFHKATKYRGASAHNMKEEFAAYGLPAWFMYVVGFLKVSIAVVMIITLIKPTLMTILGVPALWVLAVLMIGAIVMHVKLKDPLQKTLPALVVLLMALTVIALVG